MEIDFSPKAIADWIGDRTDDYNYHALSNCALAQYVASKGMTDILVGGFTIDYTDATGKEFDDIVIPDEIVDVLRVGNFATLKAELLSL